MLYLGNYAKETTVVANNAYGMQFPDRFLESDTAYYWMNPDNKKVSGSRETGWISKADGVKVLTDKEGQPIGFPQALPSGVDAGSPTDNEFQTHYTTLRIESIGNDTSVQVGFYDISKKEFVTNVQGEPEMTFVEYLQRGRNNIYVAVVSTYEVATTSAIPDDDDAPLIPYKWAMPVYGVYKRTGSKIGMGKLSPSLGPDDHWPLPIKTGKFDRQVYIRPTANGSVLGWLGKYQGSTLSAHYSVPEAQASEWSSLWGPPFVDVKGEQPDILDDDKLRVRQAPILARTVPTPNPSLADPVRPVFTVSHRDSVEDGWEQLSPSDIKDYNVSTGEIYLKVPMSSTDPELWKVDYTSDRKTFQFKGTATNIIDTNPYSIYSTRFMDGPTYVYVMPEYVRDKSSMIIADSVNRRTINTTTDPSIFDELSPTYNPLAIQLGVIYLSTALDIDDLSILDTRTRGGGVRADANLEEIKRITQEAANYWDINTKGAPSYQRAGFVVIRLPEELKVSFTEQEIVEVIERNITAGVKFKIEDLSGKDWS